MSFIKVKFKAISLEVPKNADSPNQNKLVSLKLNIDSNNIHFELNQKDVKDNRNEKSENESDIEIKPNYWTGVSNEANFNRESRLKLDKNGSFDDNIYYNPSTNSISGFYLDKNQININLIDNLIGDRLLKEGAHTYANLEKRLKQIEVFLSKPRSRVERKLYLAEKDKIEKQLSQGDLYMEYKNKIRPLIEGYNQNRKVDFDSFIEATTKYVNYDLVQEQIIENKCKVCGYDFEGFNNEIVVCNRCGCENVFLNKIKTNMEVNISNKNKKSKNEANFEDGYLRFIGEYSVKLPLDLESKLDRYFITIGLPIGREIRKMESIEDGTKWIKPGTNIDLMIKSLKWCNLNEYYKHVRYVCQYYWGWSLKRYDHLLEELMFRYKVTSNKYNQIKEGSSNLNNNFHLRKLIQAMGCPCKDNDFKKVKVKTTIKKYEQYWKKIMEMVNDDDECIYWKGRIINWN